MKYSALKQLSSLLLASAMLCTQVSLFAEERHDQTVEDLAYGLSLFQFYQANSLGAITEIDVGKYKNALENQSDDAELLLGGLYFSYGLPDDAEQIFNQLLQQDTAQETQDRIWFNLARVQYDQNNFNQAADLLTRITDELPAQREAQKQHLLTNLHIKNQQYELAGQATRQIKTGNIWRHYSEYNLGVALTDARQLQQGESWLKDLSSQKTTDKELLNLLDSTHLALGLNALKQQDSDDAIDYFNKVRLSGPLSSKAMLGAGWAWSKKSDPDQALRYWLTLRDNGLTDGATQESILAIPHAIEQKGDKAVATQYYDQAARAYDQLLHEMDLVIDGINQDELLIALHANRLVRDKTNTRVEQQPPQTRATAYLHQMFASKRFQLEIRHYQELLDIQSTLREWENSLPVLELMLTERRQSFENKRPQVEKSSSFAQLEEMQQQRDTLADSVNQIARDEDYLALANEDETDYLDQLEDIQSILEKYSGQQDFSEEQQKFRLLSGLLHWQLSTEFPKRFWTVKRELELLNRALEQATTSSQSLKQAAELNDLRLDDFDQRIVGQNEQTKQQLKKVTELIAQQEQHINNLAIAAIETQKQHVIQLRLSARYSLARLYDELSGEGTSQ